MPELTQGESLVRNRDIDEIDALIAERDKLKEQVAYEKRCRDANQKAYHEARERVSELEEALSRSIASLQATLSKEGTEEATTLTVIMWGSDG
jgi:hypothetical protein